MPDYPIDPGPLMDLALLHRARKLLLKLEQLTVADEVMLAEQVRQLLRHGTRQPVPPDASAAMEFHFADLADASTPPIPGFTVAERTAALGYVLTDQQAAALLPRLERRVRERWTRQYEGLPMQHGGADWYGVEDRPWVDATIQRYLQQFPGLQRAEGQR